MLKLALIASTALVIAGQAAAETRFSDFTPLPGNVAADSLPEAKPFELANQAWKQQSIAERNVQLALGQFNSGNWDMQTVNETGPEAGRYLFTGFETGQAGIQRTDLLNGGTTTIWQSPAPGAHVAFDASLWTPWGTYLTAEESWSDPLADPSTQTASPYGRLFEVTNPLADPASINIVHRDILPRVSHEGLEFDADGNFYFIDERNNSHIYRYTSTTPGVETFFDEGQTSVLRVGDGTVDRETGAFSWIPLTDTVGNPLQGSVIVTDGNGLTALDGRATPNLPDFLGTNYNRPEDLELKTLADGTELLFFAATTDDEVYAINLTDGVVTRYADPSTIDAATGLPVGDVFNNADNLAIDADGNIYVIEDQPGGSADIWFTTDADHDGIAESVARWASLSTVGAEPTGLYFDPFNSNVAYVNIQHPASGNDRTIRISAVPLPPASAVFAVGLLGLGGIARRRS